jgi:hypothetical protein
MLRRSLTSSGALTGDAGDVCAAFSNDAPSNKTDTSTHKPSGRDRLSTKEQRGAGY